MPGTLLILRKGHRVCDLMIYSENFNLYLIQISIQSYMDHDKKILHLTDKLKKTEKTVIEFYMDLCQKSDGIQQFAKVKPSDLRNVETRLPKGVYYVYVSMSNSSVRKTTSCFTNPVVLVRQDDLGGALGALWELYKNEF
ncbi:hypothetical protein BC938DRAFT_479074 [Jimgerdemannia flammicorona]|nr:hypothetical protein BC938DRAFT_479074 [Jimgerdemannia flammicorona]RUS30686.1 hypothetical protein BC938DRAFT_479074 [Jimgerdemannia flammicorona]